MGEINAFPLDEEGTFIIYLSLHIEYKIREVVSLLLSTEKLLK